jgi:hypothetical protein
VDLETYVNKVYQISVRKKEKGKGTRVESVTVPLPRAAGDAPVAGPPPGKSPAPPNPPAAGPPPPDKYWVVQEKGAKPVQMTDVEIRLFLKTFNLHPADVPCVLTGQAEWRTAQDYGFDLPF